MNATPPCYRHPRGVWMAATAPPGHLAVAVARRDKVVAVLATRTRLLAPLLGRQ